MDAIIDFFTNPIWITFITILYFSMEFIENKRKKIALFLLVK
ncbi:hypothetical protein N581_06805 [Lactobacillus jensenii MD IIE-70(2)]|nr:hypothetical protein N581_06805 [Lactobacillus jensenii MD IIE-70(2)]